MSFGRASNGSDVGTAEQSQQSRYVDLLPLKLRASSHGAVGLGKRLYTLGASQRLASGPALHASGAVPYPNLCTVVETCDDTSEQDPDHRQMHHDLQKKWREEGESFRVDRYRCIACRCLPVYQIISAKTKITKAKTARKQET